MDQRKITILTLLVVLIGAVGINEFIIKNSIREQNREVASFGERFEPEQIKWEHELARTIATHSDRKTKIGSLPSAQERLMFELFGGHYQAISQASGLKISLLPNQAPLNINTHEMIQNYSEIFNGAVGATTIKTENNTETVQLSDKSGLAVGTVTVERDEQGLVKEITVK